MGWRERINGALRRTTGYHLVRGDSVPPQRAVDAKSVAAELTAATTAARAVRADLEKSVVAAKAAAKASATPPPPKPKPASASRELPKYKFPDDFEPDYIEIMNKVRQYTMTNPEKLHSLIAATRYISDHNIPGAFLECGVWRGGSMHAVAHALDARGDHSRDLYLFDTYEGMTEPTGRDTRWNGTAAADQLATASKDAWVWAIASLDDVKQGFEQNVNYPADKLHFVVGKVEDTIPQEAPDQIALLRLDTDWYESTRHELEHLWDRLVPGGALIIDDYGTWKGSKDATDEWLEKTRVPVLMLRAGRARIIIKPHA